LSRWIVGSHMLHIQQHVAGYTAGVVAVACQSCHWKRVFSNEADCWSLKFSCY